MEIQEFKKAFDEINKLKSKAKMNRSQFCSELTKSDEDDYLQLHFDLLAQNKHYFQSDLKMFFGFRQDKAKTDRFLRNKLNSVTDKELCADIEEILHNIGYFPLDEYKKWFSKVKTAQGHEYMDFVFKLAKSPYTDYHYSLLTNMEISEEFRRHLWHSFEEHGEEAEMLLLSKLDKNENIDFQADIIFALGIIADQKHGKQKDKTVEYARKFANADNDKLREQAIIVLGWIGGAKEMPLLAEHLLNDTCAKCRTWSATSFMQMYFRRKSKSLVERALPFLRQAISAEKDLFALGVMIDVIKELTGKNFGLPQYAIDHIDEEKILAAKAKAERYFDKIK